MNIERATARDRAELLAFLLGVFRAGRPDHPPFEDIYPDLFLEDDEVLGRHAVIRENGRIAACVGTYLIPMQVGGCRVVTAGVGQVATAPEARGKGYMTALLRHELDRCREEGASVAWLGGRRDRYSHFGFDCAGLAFDYRFDAASTRRDTPIRTIRHVAATDEGAITDAMFALRDRTADTAIVPLDTFRLQMTRLGFKFEIWSSFPEGADTPDAWAVVDASRNRVEEWCGSAGGRLDITRAYCLERGALYRLESPADAEMNALLRERSVYVGVSTRTLAVLDAPGLLADLAPLVPEGFSFPKPAPEGPALARLLFGPDRSAACLPFYMPGIFHV